MAGEKDYVIFTDAGADLPASLCAQSGLRGIPMEYCLAGQEGLFDPTDPAREQMCASFYAALRAGATVSTSQITPYAYEQTFAPVLAAGSDILYCCFSSGMSSTWQNVQAMSADLQTRWPGRRIRCVDSLSAAGGQGAFALQAAQNRAAGMSLDENADWLTARTQRVRHWFTVSNLDFLKRGGRVSPTLAFLGGKLQIKPLMIIGKDGKLQVTGRARGRRASMEDLAASYAAAVDFGDAEPLIIVSHAGSPEDGAALAEMVQAASPAGTRVELVSLSPIIGAHTGPDALTLCGFAAVR